MIIRFPTKKEGREALSISIHQSSTKSAKLPQLKVRLSQFLADQKLSEIDEPKTERRLSSNSLFTMHTSTHKKVSLLRAKNKKSFKLFNDFNRMETDSEHNFIGKKYLKIVEQRYNTENHGQTKGIQKKYHKICQSLRQMNQSYIQETQKSVGQNKSLEKQYFSLHKLEKANKKIPLKVFQRLKSEKFPNKRRTIFAETNVKKQEKYVELIQSLGVVSESIEVSPWNFQH